jgi:hypothetical protein
MRSLELEQALQSGIGATGCWSRFRTQIGPSYWGQLSYC